MIPLKTKQDLEIMRQGGKILAKIIEALKSKVKEGLTTLEIDELASNLMKEYNVVSAFKNYKGFPGHICISVNEEVVHGIPSSRVLKDKDIVSIDIGIIYQGFYLDSAFTIGIGKISPEVKKLLEVTKNALYEGIKKAKKGNHLSDISYAIQSYVEAGGFSVVRDFVGHGIGKSLHEEPPIPNFGKPKQGPLLKEGMVLAIEPMVNMGSWEVEISSNGWTALTKDRLPSAHFEHTVAVDNEPQILTL